MKKRGQLRERRPLGNNSSPTAILSSQRTTTSCRTIPCQPQLTSSGAGAQHINPFFGFSNYEKRVHCLLEGGDCVRSQHVVRYNKSTQQSAKDKTVFIGFEYLTQAGFD